MLTNTDTALVRLYYENFGLSVCEIAPALNLPKPVVEAIIEENGLVAPTEKKLQEDKKAALLARDLDKQLVLSPYYARTEIVLLGKIMDMAESIDPQDPMCAGLLSTCARAWKDLRSSGTQAKLDTTEGQSGVTVQILNQL